MVAATGARASARRAGPPVSTIGGGLPASAAAWDAADLAWNGRGAGDGGAEEGTVAHKLQRAVCRCGRGAQNVGARALRHARKWSKGQWALVVLAVMAAWVLGETELIVHLPIETPRVMVPVVALAQTNPRVGVSPGIRLFSLREFSRVCCSYGPTIFRGSTFVERHTRHFGFGERGIYDYGAALTEFSRQRDKMSTTVFVPMAMMDDFLNKFFIPLRKDRRVVLVTGQEDCGPAELFGLGRAKCDMKLPLTLEAFVRDARLVRWFSQNYDFHDCGLVPALRAECRDPQLPPRLAGKLEALPIGLDYHTLAEKAFAVVGNRQSPAAQEQQLLSFSRTPWAKKKLKAVAIFSTHHDKPDRQVLVDSLADKAACVIRPDTTIPRESFWELHNTAAFVFAPQGNGIDTHRIYETLNLHSVPVVRSSPLDDLYRQFPIIILDDWHHFSSCDDLSGWHRDIVSRFGPDPFAHAERLTLEFWRRHVAAALP